MVTLLKVLGWLAIAVGAPVCLLSVWGVTVGGEAPCLYLVLFVVGASACYWGYLLARDVPEDDTLPGGWGYLTPEELDEEGW